MGVPLEVTAAAQRYKCVLRREGKPPMVVRLVFYPDPRAPTPTRKERRGKAPRVITNAGYYLSVHRDDLTIIGPFDNWSLPEEPPS